MATPSFRKPLLRVCGLDGREKPSGKQGRGKQGRGMGPRSSSSQEREGDWPGLGGGRGSQAGPSGQVKPSWTARCP